MNNFKDSDAKCTAAIADQQTKPIFNAPFKPKQWPRRGSRQFGDIFLHTKVGMSAIYSLTTKPQATDFFRQFVYLLTEQKPETKTFWFYKGILLIFCFFEELSCDVRSCRSTTTSMLNKSYRYIVIDLSMIIKLLFNYLSGSILYVLRNSLR